MLRPVIFVPVSGNIDVRVYPHPLVLLHVIQKTRQSRLLAGSPRQTAVQPHTHHLGCCLALGVEYVENIPQVSKKLIAGIKPLTRSKPHIVVVEGVGNY